MAGITGELAAESLRTQLDTMLGVAVVSVGYGAGVLYVYLKRRPPRSAIFPKKWKKHRVEVIVSGAPRPAGV